MSGTTLLSNLAVRPYRLTARFSSLRHAYSYWRASTARPPLAVTRSSMVAGLDAEAVAQSIARTGIHQGFSIPAALTDALLRFAHRDILVPPGRRLRFRHGDVERAHLATGEPIPLADVAAAHRHPAALALRHDPVLLEAIGRVLGYPPQHADIRLFWSFAGAMSDDERRRHGQTIDFHYDVPWFNAVYAYVYLTDTDRLSGAHVVIPDSTADMPARFRMSSCFRQREELLAYYGGECERIIAGPAGSGFIENPFIYHRALPPQVHDRLVLQLRFH
jgi:hypothetical protein